MIAAANPGSGAGLTAWPRKGGGRGARGCDSYISVGSCRYRGARASNGGVRPPPVPREVGLSGPPGHGHVYGEQ